MDPRSYAEVSREKLEREQEQERKSQGYRDHQWRERERGGERD